MAQPAPIHEPHHVSHLAHAVDHLEDEFKSLEGVTRFGRPIRIVALVLFLAALVAGAVWWVANPPTVTSSRASYLPTTGSPMELDAPKAITFADPPTRFAWESVNGRLQYVVRIYVKGSGTSVVERMSTTTSIELTPGEQARMPRRSTFVWTVVAQGKDGSTLAAGQSTFKVR